MLVTCPQCGTLAVREVDPRWKGPDDSENWQFGRCEACAGSDDFVGVVPLDLGEFFERDLLPWAEGMLMRAGIPLAAIGAQMAGLAPRPALSLVSSTPSYPERMRAFDCGNCGTSWLVLTAEQTSPDFARNCPSCRGYDRTDARDISASAVTAGLSGPS